ncbi:hypothetical protein SAMN05660860_02208 [Geoalkalibacter ferrihydriticus]|uniref:Methyltransferase type 11 n=2 Tax=Geoalkalibacter ferrihydriticus TaxID=392333 RepID=A0A0C2DUW4_9BACT|nr:hypothetical protein GFER_00090 [Geoalkalibacter ferrihydriticus DSM 17813]SDM25029.1 hypothetical protein SAMN05660860_02208 [Geoalkalibacter ferrihydriticus]
MTSENRPKTEQKSQWDKVFLEEIAFFGQEPGDVAKKSLELFRREAVRSVLELGCGTQPVACRAVHRSCGT